MPEALPEALVTTEDFSLVALFLRADLIVQAVMAILALASVWSLAVAIDRFFSISGAKSRAKKFEQAFWAGQPMEDLTDRVTDKPAEVRMGKGKGAVDYWAARVHPGRIMFEIDGVADDIARDALKLGAAKLPIKTRIVTRIDAGVAAEH